MLEESSMNTRDNLDAEIEWVKNHKLYYTRDVSFGLCQKLSVRYLWPTYPWFGHGVPPNDATSGTRPTSMLRLCPICFPQIQIRITKQI